MAGLYEMGNPKEEMLELRRGDTMESPSHKESFDMFGGDNTVDQTTFDSPSHKKSKFRRKGSNKIHPEDEGGESPDNLKGKRRSKSRNKRKMKKGKTRSESIDEGGDIFGNMFEEDQPERKKGKSRKKGKRGKMLDELEVRDFDEQEDNLQAGHSPHMASVNVKFTKHPMEDNLATDANSAIGRKRRIMTTQIVNAENEGGPMDTSDLIKANKLQRTSSFQVSGWSVFCTILGVIIYIHIYIYIYI